MCLLAKIFKPLLQCRMFLVVVIVFFACPDVNVLRVQSSSTDVSSPRCRIRTELANTPALCLSEELFRKIDELLVRYAEEIASWNKHED